MTHKWYRFNDAQVELIDEKSLLEEIGAREPAAANEGDAATTADATTAAGTATTATASADTAAAAASDTTSGKGTDAATTGAGGGAGGGAGAGADGDDKVTKDGSTITPKKKEKKEEVPKQAGGDPMANAYMLVYRRVDDSTAPKPITDKVTAAHTRVHDFPSLHQARLMWSREGLFTPGPP